MFSERNRRTLAWGRVSELVDDRDSKSRERKLVRVRFPPRPLMNKKGKRVLAYITGVALGDGNLSNPNGRAIRLRITCDTKYPLLIKDITSSLQYIFSKNKVSIVRARNKDTYLNISVYSNRLEKLMPWRVGKGGKQIQRAHVPAWIKANRIYIKECLKGLIQTDGSIYRDRGYLMINFTNNCFALADDVYKMLQTIGFRPTFTTTAVARNKKYTVRIARQSDELIKRLRLYKA